jgi:hypothetical protein
MANLDLLVGSRASGAEEDLAFAGVDGAGVVEPVVSKLVMQLHLLLD